MPRVDFTETPDAQSFDPLPDGHYNCEVVKCVERTTQKGDTQWGLELQVIGGEYNGRKIFDSILFQLDNPKGGAMSRTKLVLSRLGFNIDKPFNVEPVEAIGRKVVVTCAGVEEYKDKKGEKRTKNIVPFDGYTKHGDQIEDNLPF